MRPRCHCPNHPNGNHGGRGVFHDLDEIFRAIVAYKREHDGNSPSVQELADLCGISSKSVMVYNLRRLERAGRVRLVSARRSRSIEVVGGGWTYQPIPSERATGTVSGKNGK